MKPSPVLQRIAKGDLCSGCGLCASAVGPGRIEMRMSPAGYLRPVQVGALDPSEERLVNEVCPGIRLHQRAKDQSFHPIWGPVIKARVGHATDADLRFTASSGGALSAILLYLLDSGSVDFAVQVATAADSPILNTVCESRSRDDVFRAAGSRYCPSAPLEKLHEHLERPGRFVFVGKPCDVAGLRSYARFDSRVDEKVPVIVSFFCAGIPSLDGTRQILEELEVKEPELVNFRYRGHGWPGSATARTRDGQEYRMSYARSWGDILSNHLQFRCKICPDGSGGFADLVFGDAWYGDERGFPTFEDRDGRSFILTRTETGERIVQEAVAAGYIEVTEIDIDEIEKMQPYQARRKQLVLSRLAAMGVLGRVVPRFSNMTLWSAARSERLLSHIRSFLGMARRIVLRRT